PELYTLSLHDALPICSDLAKIVFGEPYEVPHLVKPPTINAKLLSAYAGRYQFGPDFFVSRGIYAIREKNGELLMVAPGADTTLVDRKSTRLNSSHVSI